VSGPAGAGERLRDRFAGALLGTFAGDALGMPVENWPAAKIARTLGRLDHFRTAAMWLRGYAIVYGSLYDPIHSFGRAPLARGTYTDDTQMTIAVAESLAECGGFDGADMARRFVESFDPRRGYGRGTIQAIHVLRRGVPWDKVGPSLFGGTGSFGNGAAMRAAPLALFYNRDPAKLREAVSASSAITHAHPLGIEGALIQAAAIMLALESGMSGRPIQHTSFLATLAERSGPIGEVFSRKLDGVRELLAADPSIADIVDCLGANATAQGSVPAAVYAFLRNSENLKEAIVFAVSLGGDTDTIGAMTGAIAGAYHGATAIPRDWLDALENGPKGRAYVERLANQLFEASGNSTAPASD
jgi:poly(ADP-ribose) glycohydrolase ARH3